MQEEHIEKLKDKFGLQIDVDSIQLMLSFRKNLYLLHTQKQSF